MQYTYNSTLLSHKKEGNNATCSNMDEPRDYYTKWSKSERKTNAIWYQAYVESKIWHKLTYLYNRNGLEEIENRLMVAKREASVEQMDRELGISRCKVL